MSVVARNLIDMPMPGMAVSTLDAGKSGSLYVQNLRWQNGRWGTRGGFGLLSAWSSLPLPGRLPHTTTAVQYMQQDSGKEYLVVIGHQPVVTSILANTNPQESTNLTQSSCWVVSLFDIQAGRWMQTILTKRSNQTPLPLYAVAPVRAEGGWELNSTNTTAAVWSQSGYNPLSVRNPNLPWSFAKTEDKLLFSHKDVGTWIVQPGLIASDRFGVDSVSGRDNQSGFGESAWLFPLVVRDGVVEGVEYISADILGVPDSIAQWQGRTILVSGRSLFFSDANYPLSYASVNSVAFLTETPIRAVIPVRNGVLVLTSAEAILYVPSEGATVGLGSSTLLSSTTGIVPSGPLAVASVNESVVWVSTRGVHQYAGGSSIETIMPSVANLWSSTASTGPVPSPLTSFPLDTGRAPTDQTTAQVNPLQELDLSNVFASWEPKTQELYLSFPNSNRTLVYAPEGDNGSAVAWWVEETQANGTINPVVAPQTKLTTTIPGLRLFGVPSGQQTYGVDKLGHIYVLQRGGALDVSSHPSEDHTNPVSMNWKRETAIAPASTSNLAAYYVGPAYRLPRGYRTSAQTTTQDVWEARVWVQVPDCVLTGDIVDGFDLDVQIDLPNWRWLCQPGVADLDVALGSTFQTIAAGFTQIEAVNGGGVSDPDGQIARIVWSTPGPATWATHPDPGLQPHQWYELCRLRMRAVGANQTAVDNFVSQISAASISTNAPITLSAAAYYGKTLDRRVNEAYGHDARQQPVDWAYHTPMIGDGSTTMKLRGLWVRAQRSGSGLGNKAADAWPFGPYNWLYATNDRDLSAREYEEPSGPVGVGTGQINDTMPTLNNATGGVSEQLWGSTLCRWGSDNAGDQGTIIVGTTPVQQWACTSGGRGETARWLLFGYVRNRAEYIRFASTQTFQVISRGEAPRKRRGGQ